jgi:uncharacterized spore protein YtfJ
MGDGPPVLPPGSRGRGALQLRRVLARVTGARLCYGKPVRAGDRTVIPVASVQIAGGGGFGSGDGAEAGSGTGGGGGGWLSATPVGYIEVSPERARFRPIVEPVSMLRAVVALGGATAGARGLLSAARWARRRPEASPRLLPRSRRR